MDFPTKNDHFGVFWGYHHLRKHPYIAKPLGYHWDKGFDYRYRGTDDTVFFSRGKVDASFFSHVTGVVI